MSTKARLPAVFSRIWRNGVGLKLAAVAPATARLTHSANRARVLGDVTPHVMWEGILEVEPLIPGQNRHRRCDFS